jgi:hypothetical protein
MLKLKIWLFTYNNKFHISQKLKQENIIVLIFIYLQRG